MYGPGGQAGTRFSREPSPQPIPSHHQQGAQRPSLRYSDGHQTHSSLPLLPEQIGASTRSGGLKKMVETLGTISEKGESCCHLFPHLPVLNHRVYPNPTRITQLWPLLEMVGHPCLFLIPLFSRPKGLARQRQWKKIQTAQLPCLSVPIPKTHPFLSSGPTSTLRDPGQQRKNPGLVGTLRAASGRPAGRAGTARAACPPPLRLCTG